ncbi:MAG: DNA phosphorothioation-dependent restriction protein DptF [Sarcina sp.]
MLQSILKKLKETNKQIDKNYEESKCLQELNKLAIFIDDNIFTNPSDSIVKSRKFAEFITEDIILGEGDNISYILNYKQVDRLAELSKKKLISSDILDDFHKVRKIGNIAVHDRVEGELASALAIHKSIYNILVWYIEEFVSASFKAEKYEEPELKVNSRSDFEEKLEEFDVLKQAVEELTKKLIESKSDNVEKIERGNESEKEDKTSCLVESLNRLRESSKEAVEGLESFSSFKKYMHVNRSMQKKLKELVSESGNSSTSKLILVCGSAGDGKSHIISYLKDKYPEEIGKFELWNDATESLGPKITAMETLSKVLADFNDKNINLKNSKRILAINLGTLNNFIDSEYGGEFTKLKDFVYDKKILDSIIEDNNYDDLSPFQFVNFSDYHMYELENGEEKSEYISGILNKVTNPVSSNVFYSSYEKNCTNCKNKMVCPIKLNYELLGNENVNKKLVRVLIEAIVKDKILITTRALLNFIFDVIVGRLAVKNDTLIFKNYIETMNINDYIDSLMPSLLFNQADTSFIFKSISKLDPLNIRVNELDDFIVEFNTSSDAFKYFNDNLNLPDGYLDRFKGIDIQNTVNYELKDKLVSLFIRTFKVLNKTDIFDLDDKVYKAYMKDLYYWNKGNIRELKGLYTMVKEGILQWNGESNSKEMNIFIGKNQNKYKVSEEIEIIQDLSNIKVNNEMILEKFLDDLNLVYKVGENKFTFDIDFSLYQTLQKVNLGYRPNKIDKSIYLKFVESLNGILEQGSHKKKIFISEKNKEKNKKYVLECDDFGFSFGEVR